MFNVVYKDENFNNHQQSKQICDDLLCENHHSKYKYDYLYCQTKNIIIKNINALKYFLPKFVNYNKYSNNEEIFKLIYDKMLSNIIKINLKNILDSIFTKKKIPAGTNFFSGIKSCVSINFKNFLTNGMYNEKFVFNKIKNLHEGILNNPNDRKNAFGDFYRFFDIKNKNKGTLYTTSCNDMINEKITISTSTNFFSKKTNDSTFLLILQTNKDYELYDLHAQNFTNRILFRKILTNILFNGEFNYEMSSENLQKFKNLHELFYLLPFSCEQIIKNNGDKDCIAGYWDGLGTLYEKIINHFLFVNNNISKNEIIGYISKDKAYNISLKRTIQATEYVWFNNEKTLNPICFIFKNNIIYNTHDFHIALNNFIKNNVDNILNNNIRPYNESDVKRIIKEICGNKYLTKYTTFANYEIPTEPPLSKSLYKININQTLKGGNYYYNKYLKYKLKYKNIKYKN
jgi:hypothetical protein